MNIKSCLTLWMLGGPFVSLLSMDPCGTTAHLYPWGKTFDLQYLCWLLMAQGPGKSNHEQFWALIFYIFSILGNLASQIFLLNTVWYAVGM